MDNNTVTLIDLFTSPQGTGQTSNFTTSILSNIYYVVANEQSGVISIYS